MNEANDPIVAKAPQHLDAILRLSREIERPYKSAQDLRKKHNQAGLSLGKQIIEACNDVEITGKVLAMNAKDAKRTGGTHTKVYSWVCDRLSECNGYNADYLKQCARNYLSAMNRKREADKQEPLVLKQGVFEKFFKSAPTVDELTPFVKYPPHPRMDDVAKDESEAPEQPDEVELMQQRVLAVKKYFLAPDGTPRVNPKAFKVLAKEVSEIAEAHGYAFGKSPNQPVDKRFG